MKEQVNADPRVPAGAISILMTNMYVSQWFYAGDGMKLALAAKYYERYSHAFLSQLIVKRSRFPFSKLLRLSKAA